MAIPVADQQIAVLSSGSAQGYAAFLQGSGVLITNRIISFVITIYILRCDCQSFGPLTRTTMNAATEFTAASHHHALI